MKVFWTIILALAIATGAIVLMRSNTTPAAPPTPAPHPTTAAMATPQPAGTQPEPAPLEAVLAEEPEPPTTSIAGETLAKPDEPTAADQPETDDTGAPETPAGNDAPLTVADAGDALNDALDIESDSRTDDTAEEPVPPVAETTVNEAQPELIDATADIPAEPIPAGTPSHQPGHQPGAAPSPDLPDANPDASAQQTIERTEDGHLLIDGKYVVRGAGTAQDPYEVPWDLILTARDTYRPRLGRKDIPSGLQHLDGAWLRVRGYMLLPLMGTDIRELLMMRNQWDGCCIGIPPTPYDAIEVKLKDVPTSLSRWRVNFGAVTGRFKIDPYERKDWLLSLYVMEDAEIAVTGF